MVVTGIAPKVAVVSKLYNYYYNRGEPHIPPTVIYTIIVIRAQNKIIYEHHKPKLEILRPHKVNL